ncbi:hypothetical protein AQJ43_00640 [Streptomyces avermitilis]|nr:hypothetical protein AQJ43_00640 [Streptomyces avermitilis]
MRFFSEQCRVYISAFIVRNDLVPIVVGNLFYLFVLCETGRLCPLRFSLEQQSNFPLVNDAVIKCADALFKSFSQSLQQVTEWHFRVVFILDL